MMTESKFQTDANGSHQFHFWSKRYFAVTPKLASSLLDLQWIVQSLKEPRAVLKLQWIVQSLEEQNSVNLFEAY